MPISEVYNMDCMDYMKSIPDKFFDEISYLKSIYHVTKDGKIIRISDKKELKPSFDKKGYLRIRLHVPLLSHNPDKRKPYKVHRLVAMYYLDDYSPQLQVNHKNGNKSDNRVENLEMVTNRDNVIHAWKYLDKVGRLNKLNKRRDPINGRFRRECLGEIKTPKGILKQRSLFD